MDSDDDEENDGMDPLSRGESKQVTYSENKMRKHLLADYEADQSAMTSDLAEAGQASRLKLGSLSQLPGPSIATNPMKNQGQLPPVPLAFSPTPRGEGQSADGMTSSWDSRRRALPSHVLLLHRCCPASHVGQRRSNVAKRYQARTRWTWSWTKTWTYFV